MFRRHRHFLTAFAAGLLLGALALGGGLRMGDSLLVAANSFFLIYILLMLQFARRVSPDDLRRHAELSDEGVPMIAALALGAVGLSLTGIAHALARGSGLEAGLAVASVPLGWAMLHMLAGFHYGCLFYAAGKAGDQRGLVFPGAETPGAWDFFYFAFVIGMTAQVSDVVVERPALRRLVLGHGIVSFFYNTVILALAVNAAVTAALSTGVARPDSSEPTATTDGWLDGFHSSNDPARIRIGEPPHLRRVLRAVGAVFAAVGAVGLIVSFLPLVL